MRLGEVQNPGPAEHERDSWSSESTACRCPSSTARPRSQTPADDAGDLSNNSLVIHEWFYNVLSAARTRSHTLDIQIVVLWDTQVENMEASHSHKKVCSPATAA